MQSKKKRKSVEVNSSSMADIAFLLLIFFLVTTTINSDKGIWMRLPPASDDRPDVEIKERNVFNVLVNNRNEIMAEGELIRVEEVGRLVKNHILNRGEKENLSESPDKAIVSYKTDRQTDYELYINVLDKIKEAYHQVRADEMGISLADYLQKMQNPEIGDKAKLKAAAEIFPMLISEAEPAEAAY